MTRKGIILAGGQGRRLAPLSKVISKHLLPVYDKPMIYYPLSVLMLAGIREILLISTPEDLPLFQRLLADGSAFGLRLKYAIQPKPEGIAQALLIGADFLGESPSALVLGDNLFYGQAFAQSLQAANAQSEGASIFAYPVSNPAAYGVVELAADGRPRSIEEKPLHPKSNHAIPGLYFYDPAAPKMAARLQPSPRGELEISDLNRLYLERGQVTVQLLDRNTVWFDTGTHDSLLTAAKCVQTLQTRHGRGIAYPEEIAFRRGWINRTQLESQAFEYSSSIYGEYLHTLLSGDPAYNPAWCQPGLPHSAPNNLPG